MMVVAMPVAVVVLYLFDRYVVPEIPYPRAGRIRALVTLIAIAWLLRLFFNVE